MGAGNVRDVTIAHFDVRTYVAGHCLGKASASDLAESDVRLNVGSERWLRSHDLAGDRNDIDPLLAKRGDLLSHRQQLLIPCLSCRQD